MKNTHPMHTDLTLLKIRMLEDAIAREERMIDWYLCRCWFDSLDRITRRIERREKRIEHLRSTL